MSKPLEQLLQNLGAALSTADTNVTGSNYAGSSDTALGPMPAQTTVDQLLQR